MVGESVPCPVAGRGAGGLRAMLVGFLLADEIGINDRAVGGFSGTHGTCLTQGGNESLARGCGVRVSCFAACALSNLVVFFL